MGYRRKARESALQMLFQIDLTGDESRVVRRNYWAANPQPVPVREYADRLVKGATEHRSSIDAVLDDATHNWRIDRLAAVDRNVLRMAVYELLFEKKTPRKVVINEAIDVAKKFGSEQSGQFVNGILDSVKNGLESVTATGG